jgi:hypothetical protein
MAWIGIGLSVLCVAGIIVAWPALKREIDKLDNPGCDTASAVLATADADIAAADGNAGTIEVRLRTAIAGLHQAEGQSTNAEATAAIRKLATDFQEYYDAIDTNQPAAADLTSRIRTDGGAIDGACGRIF